MTSLGFGVGCYMLVPSLTSNDDASRVRTRDWWQDRLTTELEKLTSITDISVDIRNTTAMAYVEPENELSGRIEPYDIDMDFGPTYGSFVGFSVTIPSRLQTKYDPQLKEPIGCERFQFITAYGRHGPVTAIRPLDQPSPEFHFHGSALMVLVREFLEAEIDRSDAELHFCTQGPSPFWGDFELVPDPAWLTEMSINWDERDYGYDRIEVGYKSGEQGSVDAFAHVIMSRFLDPFSLYYQLERSRERRLTRAEKVSNMADSLIAVHSDRSVLGWLKKTFQSGNLAQELLLRTISAKQIDERNLRHDSETLERMRTYGADFAALQRKCKETADESGGDEIDSAQEVAKLLEGGRIKRYEILLVTASTALGGVAGAVASIIAG